ncbi:hypothetical protein L2E82_48784 [Cichorium intybus]|uniref:Uncharacterized protein n=1 Tax=Cichorium intybus TaxID=13427 RepID=A0ACB8Z011_CICIN|nr:hypothetical protein L2E82_48784 [Cichorium intybus]
MKLEIDFIGVCVFDLNRRLLSSNPTVDYSVWFCFSILTSITPPHSSLASSRATDFESEIGFFLFKVNTGVVGRYKQSVNYLFWAYCKK